MKSKFVVPLVLASASVCFLFFQVEIASSVGFLAVDPGVRDGPSGAGGPIAGLSDSEGKFFEAPGTVVYSLTAGIGVSFHDVRPQYLSVLKRWLLSAVVAKYGTKPVPGA